MRVDVAFELLDLLRDGPDGVLQLRKVHLHPKKLSHLFELLHVHPQLLLVMLESADGSDHLFERDALFRGRKSPQIRLHESDADKPDGIHAVILAVPHRCSLILLGDERVDEIDRKTGLRYHESTAEVVISGGFDDTRDGGSRLVFV